MVHGDPVRIGFAGTPGSTSASLNLITPGSNVAYPFQTTDFLYLTSLQCQANGVVDILSAAAGASTATSSTLLASFNSTGFWHEHQSEGASGPQGILPSVFTPTNTTSTDISGTGFVVHSPGPGMLVTVVQPPSTILNNLVTSTNLSTTRNNFTGFVGIQFTVGPAPVTVVALARWNVAGNTSTHTVMINSTTAIANPVVSTTINTTLGTPGTYQFVPITPTTLLANTTYFFGSQEVTAGDFFYDTTAVVLSPDFTTTYAPAFAAGSWGTTTPVSTEFVPMNFQYHL